MLLRTLIATMLLLLVGFGCHVSAAPEIWIASTPRCNSCDIYKEIDARRGYGDEFEYEHDGRVMRIPIRHVDKAALDTSITSQLRDDIAPGDPYWDVRLIVLVVDEKKVLAAGNISESADWKEMKLPDELMYPPANPAPDDPAVTAYDYYRPFFVDSWNLEYFVAVALGDRRPHGEPAPIKLDAPNPVQLDPVSVVLWGSASEPLSNALFISMRMREIKRHLQKLDVPLQFVTLYGHGPDSEAPDTSYIADDRVRFGRVDMPVDLDASAASLSRVLAGVAHARNNRTLLVQVGHSGPAGSPIWGDMLTLTELDLQQVTEAKGDNFVMVSGGCNSGLMAKSVSCGFFAAHPDVLAAGCQLSAEAIETSDDYLRHFFAAATLPGKVGRRPGEDVPMNEAHWYAATRLEAHQIAYTTTDALIDDFFREHPAALPSTISLYDLRALEPHMTPVEARALARLTSRLDPALAIDLTNYVALNQHADEQLLDATELSSKARERMIDLPYRLMLPVLARRAVYHALDQPSERFEAASRCEKQGLRSYLTAPR